MRKVKYFNEEDKETDAILSRSLLNLHIDNSCPKDEKPEPGISEGMKEILQHVDLPKEILNDENEIDIEKLQQPIDAEEVIMNNIKENDYYKPKKDDAYDSDMNNIIVNLSDTSTESSESDSNRELEGCYPSDCSFEEEYNTYD